MEEKMAIENIMCLRSANIGIVISVAHTNIMVMNIEQL